MVKSILKPDVNCCCVKQVDQMALLVDAHNYYKALFDVAPKAHESIRIAGWAMDPQLNLRQINDSFPDNLRNYFKKLLRRQRHLQIRIQCWKPSLYLRFQREPLAYFKWRNIKNRRLHFRHDRRPFLFSSFHEKVAIFDHSCAFLGGIDITSNRWDTPSHPAHSKLRDKISENESYPPTHDLQLVFTGDLIQGLDQLLQNRFNDYSQSYLARKADNELLWPETHRPQVRNVIAALARTEPAENAYEIEQFYLDAIPTAKQFIYIENQYFTHEKITDLLAKRLQEPDGPEILVVQPLSYPGIFERAAFIKLRNQAIAKMRAADKFNRFSIVYPCQKTGEKERFILVHSKLLIIDNRILSLGSANLNHRSMRVDSEINLCLDMIDHTQGQQFILQSLFTLMGEHLGCESSQFQSEFENEGSLIGAMRKLMGTNSKTLNELPILSHKFAEKFWSILTWFIDLRHCIPKNKFYLAVSFVMMSLAIVILVSNGS